MADAVVVPNKKRWPSALKTGLLVFGVPAVVVAIWWWYGHNPWRTMDANQASQFGDSFGSVNALFAGLAFAGVIIAIFLQSRELQLQREELECNREELKRSADAQDQTQQALYMSAYLNAVASTLDGLEPFVVHEQQSEGLRNGPYAIESRQLVRELRSVMATLRSKASGFVQFPGPVAAMRLEMQLISGSTGLASTHDTGDSDRDCKSFSQFLYQIECRLERAIAELSSIPVDNEEYSDAFRLRSALSGIRTRLSTLPNPTQDSYGESHFTDADLAAFRTALSELTLAISALR